MSRMSSRMKRRSKGFFEVPLYVEGDSDTYLDAPGIDPDFAAETERQLQQEGMAYDRTCHGRSVSCAHYGP